MNSVPMYFYSVRIFVNEHICSLSVRLCSFITKYKRSANSEILSQ